MRFLRAAFTNFYLKTFSRQQGRDNYQRTQLNTYGFPRRYLTRQKRIKGFQTGDMVKAVVVKGKKIGIYIGHVAVRTTGSFNIQTANDVIQGIGHKHWIEILLRDNFQLSRRRILVFKKVARKPRNLKKLWK